MSDGGGEGGTGPNFAPGWACKTWSPCLWYRKAMDAIAEADRVGPALSVWACSPSLDSVARAGKVEKNLLAPHFLFALCVL